MREGERVFAVRDRAGTPRKAGGCGMRIYALSTSAAISYERSRAA